MSSNTGTSTFATIATTSLADVVGGAGPLPAEGEYQHGWTRSTLGMTPEQYNQFNEQLSTYPVRLAGQAISERLYDGLQRQRDGQSRGGTGG